MLLQMGISNDRRNQSVWRKHFKNLETSDENIQKQAHKIQSSASVTLINSGNKQMILKVSIYSSLLWEERQLAHAFVMIP